jgi:hypothetical protein
MVARARFGVLALALAVCSLVVAAVPSPAPAATYNVLFCANSQLPADGVTIDNSQGNNGELISGDSTCGGPNSSLLQVGGGPHAGQTSWTVADGNPIVHIVSVTGMRTLTGPWKSNVIWALTDGNGKLLDSFAGPPDPMQNPLPGPFLQPYPLPMGGGNTLTSTLTCPSGGCNVSQLSVTFTSLKATVEDDEMPSISSPLGGSVVAGGTLTGAQNATFTASDAGSGVATVAVLVDGGVFLSFVDHNGSKCEQPYHFFVPCSQTEAPNFEFPTAQLADGTHTVQAEAIDAAGNVSTSAPVMITTHNGPTNTAPPTIQGTPKLDATLTATTGTWASTPTVPPNKFTYQWLRCPATVTSAAGAGACTAIEGATNAQYTLTSADIYGRAIVKVTAANGTISTTDAFSAPSDLIADANGRTTPPGGGGGGGGGSGGGGGGTGGGGGGVIDRTPPVLSAVSLTHTRFAVAKARTAIAALVRGTALRLTSTEGGRLSIAVVRVRPGQRRGRVCRAVSRPVRRGACTLLTSVATLTRSIRGGRTSVAFSGRIGSRALAPGNYRLVLTVRDGSANVSKAAQRSFTIVRG